MIEASVPQWFMQLLEVSLIGAMVVVAGILLQHGIRKSVSSKFLYCLWMLVLLRFALIWVPASPTSALNWIQEKSGSPEIAEIIDIPVVYSETQIQSESPSVIGVTSIDTPVVTAESTFSTSISHINFWNIVIGIWIAGCLFWLIRLSHDWLRLRNLISEATCVEAVAANVSKLSDELKSKLAIGMDVRVLLTDRISSPATTGIFRPTVLLPNRCLDELDLEELELILAHELIHIRRRDGLWQLIAWIVGTIHWFNPLAHFAASRIAIHREISCDAAVLELAKTGQARKLYGQTILKLAEFNNFSSHFPTVIAHGFTGSNKHLITQRIDMIIKPNATPWIGKFLGAVLVVAMLAIGYTAAQDPLPEEAKAEKPSATQLTDEATIQLGSQVEEKIFERNSAWPKPFSSISRIHYSDKLHQQLSETSDAESHLVDEWNKGMMAAASGRSATVPTIVGRYGLPSAPGVTFIPKENLPDPEGPKDGAGNARYPVLPPVPGKPRVATRSRPLVERWESVRQEAMRKNTFYRQPIAKGEIAKAEDVIMPANVPIEMTAGDTWRFEFNKKVPELMVDTPEILRLTPMAPKEIKFNALTPGVSLVSIKFADGSSESIEVTVNHDTAALKKALKQYFPNTKVGLTGTADGIHILLQGSHVQTAKDMIKVAEDLTGAKVSVEYQRNAEVEFEMRLFEIESDAFGDAEFEKLSELFSIPKDKQGGRSPAIKFEMLSRDSCTKVISELSNKKLVKHKSQPTLVSGFGQKVDFFSGNEVIQRSPDGTFAVNKWGDSVELTALHKNGEQVTLELRVQFSRKGPPFNVRRLNTGWQTKFGETVAVLYEPNEEQLDNKTTLILITPKKLTGKK